MNQRARLLSMTLVLVFLDAAMGFGVYRKAVHTATGIYCALANKSSFERYDCTSRIFYSRTLWLLISAAMGLSAGYVTMQALKTGKW